MGAGGGKGELEIDLLSEILELFNDQFSSIQWRDKDKVRRVIAEDLPAKLRADRAYQNAIQNSDKKVAKLEHDKALGRAMLDFLVDHTELYKRFSDDLSFRRDLTDTIFELTYAQAKQGSRSGT